MKTFELKNVSASSTDKKILNNISLQIKEKEIIVLLGPNGAGKSTIAHTIMGNEKYEINGNILLNNKDITKENSTSRAKDGLFMSFQHPIEIEGVTMLNFLRTSYNLIKNTKIKTKEFSELLNKKMEFLEMDKVFRGRFLNHKFSGGEKKRSELLQLLLLEPQFAILDEIDSGLDRDGFELLNKCINELKNKSKTGFLIITHSPKIIEILNPDKVIILKKGKITEEGDSSLAKKIEEKGFK